MCLLIMYSKRDAFLNLVENDSFNWQIEEHKELLRAMLMTVCDLAAITKPWEIEKRVRIFYVIH